jgi:two-component system, sensor histidine kinase RpfC
MPARAIRGGGRAAVTLLRRSRVTIAWIARRLRNRPDSEHEMTFNRLAISGLVVAYLLISGSLGNEPAHDMLRKTDVYFATYYILSLGLFGHILWRPGKSVTRRMIGILIDLSLFTVCMHAGDESTAPLYPIYLWTIFGNGFRFGLPYLAAASALGVVSFAGVVATTPYWQQNLHVAIGLAAGLILLPLYVSTLIKKLSQAKRQAEEASRAKSAFLASVSHEFRTPLNAIIGLSDLLRDTSLNSDQREMTTTIGQSGRRLLTMINSILDFSRIEAGKIPLRREAIDLPSVLGEIGRMVEVQAHAKGIRLAVHMTDRTPHLVVGDKAHLEEVLINLAGNAVKFTEQGYVAIAVDMIERHAGSARLRFEITDTGIGIEQEAQKRIFERFTQADETIIDRFGGTGLGLATVKQLVELQGGAIGVQSAPGSGSTFWFEIDYQAPAQELGQSTRKRAPVILLSHDERVRAMLMVCIADVRLAATTAAAADLVAALRQEGVRRPIVLVHGEAGDAELQPWMSRMAEEMPARPPVFVLLTDAASEGMLAGAMRSLATTTVALPLDSAALAAALRVADGQSLVEDSEPRSADPAPAGRRLAILIAEDNRTNQMVIKKILEKAGHAATIVDNGEAALDALNDGDFDLVLMDVNMPVMNGIEATKLHRFASLGRRHVPIVALTADATDEIAARCREAGMDACLTKPIEPARLLDVVARLARDHGPAAQGPQSEEMDDRTAMARQASEAIDIPTLEALEQLGGKEFLTELAVQFIDDGADVLRDLAGAAAAGDAGAFREHLHALRSAAANIGARGIYDMCLAWRKIGTSELMRDRDTHLDLLRREFARVRAALHERLKGLELAA